MLSPEKHCLKVPRDPEGNAAYRQQALDRAENNPAVQAAMIQLCRDDFLYWVNVFVVQYNPRKPKQQVGPFLTFDRQDEVARSILDCMECHCKDDPEVHQHDILIEKSREMGASWLILLIFVWAWLFHERQQFNVMSRDEKSVEDYSPNSLFWKIDFILEHLPEWMLQGYDVGRNRRKLHFDHPTTHSVITGAASTGKSFVGGRGTAAAFDEFSQVRDDRKVLHRTADVTGCRIFNGTHIGMGTVFYELSIREDMKKEVMHWTHHREKRRGLYRSVPGQQPEILDPEYEFPPDYEFVNDGTPTGGPFPGLRSPWYDRECSRRGSSRAVAMDLDIDPKGSTNQVFDAVVVYDLIRKSSPPVWRGHAIFDPGTCEIRELREDPNGQLLLWALLRPNGQPPRSLYAAGSDISFGTGATPSVLSLADSVTGLKVMEYASSNVDPREFADLTVALCRFFESHDGTPARVAWDMSGPGIQYGRRIIERGFRNFYHFSDEERVTRSYGDAPGWRATNTSKKVLLEDYGWALRNGMFVNLSKLALEELLAFEWKSPIEIVHSAALSADDPANAGENHGDRAIADALCWKMCRALGAGKAATEKPEIVLTNGEPATGSIMWRRKWRSLRESLTGWS